MELSFRSRLTWLPPEVAETAGLPGGPAGQVLLPAIRVQRAPVDEQGLALAVLRECHSTPSIIVAKMASGRFLLSFPALEPEMNGGENSDKDSEQSGLSCDTTAMS